MTSSLNGIRFGGAVCRVVIRNVDQMAPLLMGIASDSDAWLFIGSNGPFVAGRRSPDTAFFPYQTVDKILHDPTTSGARTVLLVSRGEDTSLWEPWLDSPRVYDITRNLYKRVDGAALGLEASRSIFERANGCRRLTVTVPRDSLRRSRRE